MGTCCSTGNERKVYPRSPEVSSYITPEQKKNDKKGCFPDVDGHIVVQYRYTTDVFFIVLMILFLLVLVSLLSYTMSFGNIYRIVNGYDNCGNICGRLNTFELSHFECSGANMTEKPFLYVESSGIVITDSGQINRICVENCSIYSGYRYFLNRCIPEPTQQQVNSFFSKTGITEFFQEVSEDLNTCWREILYLCLIAFGLSVILVTLFRYVVGFVVWLVLIGVVLISIAATIFLWVNYDAEKRAQKMNEIGKRQMHTYLAYAIAATIITIIICLVIFVLRKRIRLVIQLFKEAGKALIDMPMLLLEPILTFIALAIVVSLWLYLAIWIESAGVLTVENNTSAKFVKDNAMKFTRWYNLLAMFWMTQFVIGCQHMVIAGAVATWFFTRNKHSLNSPIGNSFNNLVRYHLGTIALGSFLIAIVQFVRAILSYIEYVTKHAENRITKCLFCCCQCCLSCFESFLQHISRNAYIETAIYGYSFCVASQKAFSLLSSNSLRVFAINSVGDFVLWSGKAFVVACTIFIGLDIIQRKDGVHHNWVPLVLAGLFAYLISHTFMTVYEMTIDTIFICFCEDCERNDGLSRPYYMSRGLMDFVQGSKNLLEIRDCRANQGTWSPRNVPPKSHHHLPANFAA